jgi:hypothetical protein
MSGSGGDAQDIRMLRMRIALHFDEREFPYPEVGPTSHVVVALVKAVPEHRRHARLRSGIPGIFHFPTESSKIYRILERAVAPDQGIWSTFGIEDYRAALLGAGSFAVLVEGLTASDAIALHKELIHLEGYYGALQILLTNPVHLVLYVRSLPARIRVVGNTARVLYSFDEDPDIVGQDERDWETHQELTATHLFSRVEWENTGIVDTFFDPFITPRHSEIVGELEQLLATQMSSVIDQIILRSAVLDPRITETLHAALDLFEAHRTGEQLAQVALACRRVLERLADALYPPRTETVGGRQVGKPQYRNRLWAYVDQQLTDSTTNKSLLHASLADIGNRIDSLENLANKGLHAGVDAAEVQRLLVGLTTLTYDMLMLAPVPKGASEEPYRESIIEMLRSIVGESENLPDDT